MIAISLAGLRFFRKKATSSRQCRLQQSNRHIYCTNNPFRFLPHITTSPSNFTLLARFQDGYINQIAAALHLANPTYENSRLLHLGKNNIVIGLHPFSALNMALD